LIVKGELTELVGRSPATQAVLASIKRLTALAPGSARRPAVLIEGETGTGKGLVASLLHRTSPRAPERFVDVNCAAIPETLIEAELFGFERGAFTDARHAKAGLFQTAHRGTIFLDEVGLVSPIVQAKLLKVIEERSVRRLGSTQSEPTDAWIISATNANLLVAVEERRFREDLYHRLAVVTLSLPPLRERAGDIPLLAEHFLARVCRDHGLRALTLTDDARAKLAAHSWPGNIREPANTIERSALLCDAPRLTADMVRMTPTVTAAAVAPPPTARAAGSLNDAIREHLIAVLEETGGNIVRTAAILGIARNTLRAHMRRLNVSVTRRPREARPSTDATAAVPPSPPAPAEAVIAPPSPPPRTSIRWERRRVTVLRAELEIPSSGELDSDAARRLELVVEKIGSFGGRLEDVSPASVDASFGVDPTEDATRRAAHAAVAIQKEVGRRGDGHARRPTRIALHTSHATVAYLGATPRRSKDTRPLTMTTLDALAAAAAPDTIVVSAASANLLRHRFVFESSGQTPTGETYRVLGSQLRGFETGPRHGAFVGREREIETLVRMLDAAVEGRGGAVVLSGDAGVGKSRLVWELTRARTNAGVRVLEAGGMYFSTGPYVPIVDVLKRYFGVEPEDSAEQMRARVLDVVAARTPELIAETPMLLTLLGAAGDDTIVEHLDPPERRRRTIAVVKRLVSLEARIQPLVVVFEDVHWISAESQAVIDAIASEAASSAVLLVLTCRERDAQRCPSGAHYTRLEVAPLSAETAMALLDGLLGDDAALAALKRRLVEWTEGNPFFLEETVRALVETGALQGERGRYQSIPALPTITLPATVEEILSERIDRLALDDRALLQSAAAIGNKVSWTILEAIGEGPTTVIEECLRRLAAAEFLYETVTHDERELVFKHPLTHEVAYRSLLPEQRRALHGRILDALEALYRDADREHVDRLADHAFRGEVWGKAVIYARLAGERALAGSANHDAARYFAQALEALHHLPDERVTREQAIDLHLGLRDVMWALARLPEIQEHLSEAERIAEALGERRRVGAIACYSCQYFWSVGDYRRAIAAGERAVQTADELASPALAAEARFYLGLAYLAVGDVRRAADLLRTTVTTIDTVAVQHRGDFASRRFAVHGPVLVRGWLARILADLGEFREAEQRGGEAVALAEAADNPFALTGATVGLGAVSLRKGEHARAISILERSLALCRAYNLDSWFAVAAACLGYAYAGVGRPEGVTLLETAAEYGSKTAIRVGQLLYLIYLGETYAAAGRPEALPTARRALELCRERGASAEEGWTLRLLGDIAAGSDPLDREEAERCYAGALALAEKLELRPLAAWCHRGFARLFERVGDEASAQVYRARATALFRELEMKE
jgi:DNA-binding NtrC family response regulator/tetratricopeptide (TPR) repeat protein